MAHQVDQAEEGLSTNRAAHEVMGWALGFAAASGVAQPEPADDLLATLYTGAVAGHLDTLGVSAGAVMDLLRRRGVRAPGAELPVYRCPSGRRKAMSMLLGHTDDDRQDACSQRSVE